VIARSTLRTGGVHHPVSRTLGKGWVIGIIDPRGTIPSSHLIIALVLLPRFVALDPEGSLHVPQHSNAVQFRSSRY
jgi:hypothetical protein